MDKIFLCVGDLHLPYHCQKTVNRIYSLTYDLHPDYIIQLGDLYDMFSKSKFAKSLNLATPKEEILKGREAAEDFWTMMMVASPKSKRYQLLGNHDLRPFKRLMEKSPELELLYNDRWLWEFDGVDTIYDYREVLRIEGINFIHGYLSRLGAHAKYFLCNTVCGHSHRGGVVSFNDIREFGRPIWELNAGYAGDPLSLPFGYTASKFTHWTHGVGIIDKLGPRFVHL